MNICAFRRFFKLRTFKNYDAMIGVTHNLDTINKLKLVYPNPEDIELFPGGISELSVRNGLVGEVFANIMGLQFKKIKFGDRFWHETNDPIVRFTNGEYTVSDCDYISSCSFSSMSVLYLMYRVQLSVNGFLIINCVCKSRI